MVSSMTAITSDSRQAGIMMAKGCWSFSTSCSGVSGWNSRLTVSRR